MLLFHSTDSGVVTPRRRSLEDKETSSESTYSDVGNSNEDLFVCTEDDGPMDFSTSTQDKMSVDRADEAAGVPRTSSSGAKGNITFGTEAAAIHKFHTRRRKKILLTPKVEVELMILNRR